MSEPRREDVDRMTGLVVLEFGASWCPHCLAIQDTMSAVLRQFPVDHQIKVEDGRGLPLGRSFRVKLWPTLVLMRDGQVLNQLVRPSATEIEEGFRSLTNG